jgi:hypothetical protein
MPRLTKYDARAILTVCHVDPSRDFHTLNSDAVERLLVHADAHKYRKPKSANGSRARYFHAYLIRALSRDK